MAKKTASSSSAIPALKWLAIPEQTLPQTVACVFGDEPFLRKEVLAKMKELLTQCAPEGTDFTVTEFDGPTLTWSKLQDEVSTFSMFGPSLRLVIVNNADMAIQHSPNSFLSKNRDALEQYVAAPSETAILVLEMQSCASNTRLYKGLAERGLLVDCKAPGAAELLNWVVRVAQSKHQFRISNEAAQLLIEQVGNEMGLLDQELARLALLAEPGKPMGPDAIRKNTGTWRTQTAWDLIDCILDGNAPNALKFLGQLLDAGEEPIAILAQISSNLRRLASATRLILSAEADGQRISVKEALSQAGVNGYFLDKTAQQLGKLGRNRGKKLLDWIVELDFDMKGDSTLPKRLLLERFVLRLAAKRPTR